MEAQEPYEQSSPGCENLAYTGGSNTTPSTSPSPSPSPGPDGYALQFNGINSYLRIEDSNSLDITDEISIEAWIKANSVIPRPDWSPIVVKKCNYAECYGLLVTEDQSYIYFFVQTSGDGVSFIGDSLPLGQWVHVTGTWDRTSPENIELYFNGQSLGSGLVNKNPIRTSSYPAFVGGGTKTVGTGSYSPYYFDGLLDKIRIYAKRLPSNIVAAHYRGDYSQDNTGCGGVSCDLRAAWNFDEGAGTIAHDSSGYNNYATLINNPLWVKVP